MRLGLDVASKVGLDISGIFTNEDLQQEVKNEEINARVFDFYLAFFLIYQQLNFRNPYMI